MNLIKSTSTVPLLIVGLGLALNAISQAQQAPSFVWSKLPGHTNLPTGWASVPGSNFRETPTQGGGAVAYFSYVIIGAVGLLLGLSIGGSNNLTSDEQR